MTGWTILGGQVVSRGRSAGHRLEHHESHHVAGHEHAHERVPRHHLPAAFRHLPAAATTSDLAVGCPETARPADAGLHALGRPAEQQCTSIASSSSAAGRTALITLRYVGHSAQKYHIPLLALSDP